MAQAVAQGADQVVLPTEGWAYCYCWQRNPSQMRADYFRQFYGLPADMELVFLPRGSSELWPEVPDAMWGRGGVPPSHRKLMGFFPPPWYKASHLCYNGAQRDFWAARPMGRPLKGGDRSWNGRSAM